MQLTTDKTAPVIMAGMFGAMMMLEVYGRSGRCISKFVRKWKVL